MSLFDTTYRTIDTPAEGIFRDKGSKFIAYAYPVRHEDEVKEKLAAIKSAHPKARHYCWAYRFTPDRTIYRINDDGEPSGTAGRPILNTLLSFDVTDIVIIVVRYFGGTLLGVPGLINAYKTAAQEALHAATISERDVTDRYRISFDYLQMNDVMRIVKEGRLDIIQQDFDNRCTMILEVPLSQSVVALDRLNSVPGIAITHMNGA